jgi:ribosomal protein S18 acetylase RimI-like enzyme
MKTSNQASAPDFTIRPFHPSDIPHLYDICLGTGDSGKSAVDQFNDTWLLGQFYMAPYVHFDPEVCFTLTKNHIPVGYIIGTQDSQAFETWCENIWLPKLRKRYPMPVKNNTNSDKKDALIIRRIHEGYKLKEAFKPYPAHLHIDILPEGQGGGFGRKMTEVFIDRLKELGVSGLHLEVGKKNPGAVRFYEKMGFKQIADYEYSIGFGMKF